MPASCTPRRLLASLALLAMLACSLPGQAEAVDLRKRFGVGFNNNFSSFTSLSVKFGMPSPKPTVNIQFQGLVGFSISALAQAADDDEEAEPGVDQFFAGGRLLLPIRAEDNLNLYGGLGAGYVRQADARQLLRTQAIVGVEFFFFGLENLGCSAELGVVLDISPGQVDIETTAGSSATVGIHYYF